MAETNDCSGCKILTKIRESKFPSEKVSLISEKDNQKHEIHSIVFAASSKIFTASLGPKKVKMDEFILNGTDGETAKAIVDFCYSVCINLTEQNVSKFSAIASSLYIDLLKEKCHRFYSDNLSVANCVEALLVTDDDDLRQRAFDIVCKKFELLPASEMNKLDRRILQKMLMKNKIHLPENSVFKRLFEWFQSREDERSQSRPIFNLFIRHYDYDDDNAINIEKYNNVSGSFEEGVEIALGYRVWFNAIVHENQLFVFGGRTDDGLLNCVSSYDLGSLQETVLPPMIEAREHCVPFSSGNLIYMFGGSDADGSDIGSCECFDTVAKEWKEIKSMNIPRCDAVAAALNGCIYVVGGDQNNGDRSAVELYDPECDEWTQMQPMIEGRQSFALIKFNGSLYAMGGGVKAVEKYNPYVGCWTEIGSFDGSEDISSGINVGGQIFVIMGDGEFGKVEIDEGDKCTFIPLAKSKYDYPPYSGNHFICQD